MNDRVRLADRPLGDPGALACAIAADLFHLLGLEDLVAVTADLTPGDPDALAGAVVLILRRLRPAADLSGVSFACTMDRQGTLRSLDPKAEDGSLRAALGTAGVTRLFVHAGEQAERARRLAKALDSSVLVIGVFDLGDALIELGCLPDTFDGWRREHAHCAGEHLLAAALDGPPPAVGWPFVMGACRGLLRLAGLDPLDRWRLGLVRDIARRHGGEAVLLDWPDAALAGDRFLAIVAQAVQSAADADLGMVSDYVERARQVLGNGRFADEARVLGAVGRALAAAGRHAGALAALDDALRAWRRLDQPGQASFALCEWLRLTGLLGLQADFEAALDTDVAWVLSAAPDLTRAFVQLVIGRGWAQLGRPELALAALDDESAFAGAVQHVATARGRWRALVYDALDRPEKAAMERQSLAALPADGQLHLAAIDVALRTGASLAEPLAALLGSDDGEARRVLSRLAPHRHPAGRTEDRALIARLAREYRY